MDMKLILLTILLAWVGADTKPGGQIRMTRKGMQYLADVGKEALQKELYKATFNEKGRSGRVEYSLSNTRITQAVLPRADLSPVYNLGIKAVVAGSTVAASANIWYRYRWKFIKFSDTIGAEIKISRVNIAATVAVASTSEGKPTIGLAECIASIGSVDIKFTGSKVKAWIYNIFRGLVEKKVKGLLNNQLCAIIRGLVEDTARKEVETFPVVSKIDTWSEIDYRLTSAPTFTNNYMDLYLKGEFKSRKNPKESGLTVPDLKVSSEHDKMLYVWLSEYTVNTAGEVYQDAGLLEFKVEPWNKDIPVQVREYLNTSKLDKFIPNLSKYPNEAVIINLVSRLAPKVVMLEKSLRLYLFIDAIFLVKLNNGTQKEVFALRTDVNAAVIVSVKNKKIMGEIQSFKYDASVLRSAIGKIDTSFFTSAFMKLIIETEVVNMANKAIHKGFPLPQLKHIDFNNPEILFHKDAIQVGTDIVYNSEVMSNQTGKQQMLDQEDDVNYVETSPIV